MGRVAKVFVLLSVCCITQLAAQDILRQRISINFEDVSAHELITSISNETGYRFSYNPDILQGIPSFSANYQDQTLEKILEQGLGSTMEFKASGNYIIILKSNETDKKSDFNLVGTITDSKTGEKIQNATVYEVSKLSNTLTDEEGNYQLSVSARKDYATFAISKVNYRDTVVLVSPQDKQLNIVLTPQKEDNSNQSPLDEDEVVKKFVPSRILENIVNVEMVDRRFFQLSLLPVAGTNGTLGGKIENNVSFNIAAGFTYGVKGVELGGGLNLNRRDIVGVQLSGFGNIIGGQVIGLQATGGVNLNRADVKGLQAAGFSNSIGGSTVGLQMAGFMNTNKGPVTGVHAAGFLNLTGNTVTGLDASGFVNLAMNVQGLQATGFVNYVRRDLYGVQVAGFSNVNINDVHGLQVSGLFNYARNVSGVQIAVFNYASSYDKGVPIGFISFVKDGLHKIEVQSSDVIPVSLVLKTGVPWFYNFWGLGYNPNIYSKYAVIYGVGTQFYLADKWLGNVEMVSSTLQPDFKDGERLNELVDLQLKFMYEFGPHFSVNFGPVYHLYISRTTDPETGRLGDRIGRLSFYNRTINETLVKMWIGYQVGVRF